MPLLLEPLEATVYVYCRKADGGVETGTGNWNRGERENNGDGDSNAAPGNADNVWS